MSQKKLSLWILRTDLKKKSKILNNTLFENYEEILKIKYIKVWMNSSRQKITMRKNILMGDQFFYFRKLRISFEALRKNKIQKKKVFILTLLFILKFFLTYSFAIL